MVLCALLPEFTRLLAPVHSGRHSGCVPRASVLPKTILALQLAATVINTPFRAVLWLLLE